MKLVTFTYTDVKGKVSNRTLLPVMEPNIAYEGIDVSELSSDELGALLDEYRELKELHDAELAELFTAFDLKHNYRRFLEERMSNIKTTSN